MRKVISVSIPEPCHENWETMSPQDKGRHCDVCEKTVFDFTNKTDEQIVKTFENSGKLCGRFKTNQLDRELVFARKSKNSYRSIAATGLFAFLALHSFKSKAQNERVLSKTEVIQPVNHIKGKIATSILKTRIISGTIFDENNLPLLGANVIVKDTSNGTQTDFDGNFKLKVEKGIVIEVSFIGYETQKITINNQDKVSINLTENYDVLGALIVVGYPTENSKHTPTPEELAEEKRLYQLRIDNNEAFYKRKRQKERETRQLKRQQKRKR